MTGRLPAPGEVWQQRRNPPGTRRIIQVAEASDGNGFVTGVAWYQRQTDTGWADAPFPNPRRKTRIRTAAFLREWEPLPAGVPLTAVTHRCRHCAQPIVERPTVTGWEPDVALTVVDYEHVGGDIECDLPPPYGVRPHAEPDPQPTTRRTR